MAATGLSNAVVTGAFLAEVVHDVAISTLNWRVALEHFLLYLQKIDSGCGWQLASATSQGSQDTFLQKAMRAAGAGLSQVFLAPPLNSSPEVPLPETTSLQVRRWRQSLIASSILTPLLDPAQLSTLALSTGTLIAAGPASTTTPAIST